MAVRPQGGELRRGGWAVGLLVVGLLIATGGCTMPESFLPGGFSSSYYRYLTAGPPVVVAPPPPPIAEPVEPPGVFAPVTADGHPVRANALRGQRRVAPEPSAPAATP